MKKILFLFLLIVGFFLLLNQANADGQKVTVCHCDFDIEMELMGLFFNSDSRSYKNDEKFYELDADYNPINLGEVGKTAFPFPATCDNCEKQFPTQIKTNIYNQFYETHNITKNEISCIKEICFEDDDGSYIACDSLDKGQIEWANTYGSVSDPYIFNYASSSIPYELKVKNNAAVNMSCTKGCDNDYVSFEHSGVSSVADLIFNPTKVDKYNEVLYVEVKATSVVSDTSDGKCFLAENKTTKFYFEVPRSCNKILSPEEITNCEGDTGPCEIKCKKVKCEFVAGEGCKEIVTADTGSTATGLSPSGAPSGAMSTDAILGYYEGYYGGRPDGYNGALPDCAFSGTCRNVNDLLQLIINFGSGMFAIIGSFAFAFFIYGGFTIVTSFGNAERVKKGRDIMVAAVIGMVISLSAFLLIDFMLDALEVSDTFKAVEFQ